MTIGMETEETETGVAAVSNDKLSPARLPNVSVYLWENDRNLALSLQTALRGNGIKISIFSDSTRLADSLQTQPPDVLILSESNEVNVFHLTSILRRGELCRNPFTVIFLLVSPGKPESVEAAIRAGADSVVIKPIAGGQLAYRIWQLALNRPPFVATSDYIGPERRTPGRTSRIPLIKTINTLRYKLEGHVIAPEALDKAIALCSQQLWLAQLESCGLRILRICNSILRNSDSATYMEGSNAPFFLDLIAALEAAATTTKRVGHAHMLEICEGLTKRMKILATQNAVLAQADIQRIGQLPAIFENSRRRIT